MGSPDLTDVYTARFKANARGEVVGGQPCYDCWGLVMEVFRRFGIVVPDYGISCMDSQGKDETYKSESVDGHWKQLSDPVVPCLVAMRTNPRAPKAVSHFGVYVGDGKFLHISRGQNTSVGDVAACPFASQIVGWWQWMG